MSYEIDEDFDTDRPRTSRKNKLAGIERRCGSVDDDILVVLLPIGGDVGLRPCRSRTILVARAGRYRPAPQEVGSPQVAAAEGGQTDGQQCGRDQ
jgi:hypothetical protein